MSDTITFPLSSTQTVRVGWGVHVTPIWDVDEETDREWVSEIEVDVVKIDESTLLVHLGAVCARTEDGYVVPADLFEDVPDLRYDDHHDLRSRWFATEEQARAHAQSVQSEWDSPAPWVSFVQL